MQYFLYRSRSYSIAPFAQELEKAARLVLRHVQLRFPITSRPELPIRLGFTEISGVHQGLVLHEIRKPVIERDIKSYFGNQFSCLRQERSFASDWPGDETVMILGERALPILVAAATL